MDNERIKKSKKIIKAMKMYIGSSNDSGIREIRILLDMVEGPRSTVKIRKTGIWNSDLGFETTWDEKFEVLQSKRAIDDYDLNNAYDLAGSLIDINKKKIISNIDNNYKKKFNVKKVNKQSKRYKEYKKIMKKKMNR